MSVVGFDDIPFAQLMIPPLTTVQVSQTELAKLAFQALLSEAEDKSEVSKKREYALITNLILRRSTALAASEVPLLPSAS
jgi:DNA-binding LacI/PurR family transcriptional regulator